MRRDGIYIDTIPRYIVMVHLRGVIFRHGTADLLGRAKRRRRRSRRGWWWKIARGELGGGAFPLRSKERSELRSA